MGIRWNRLAEAVLTSTHNLCFEQKYEKKYQRFLSKIFLFLEVKFSIYLNRRVFVMADQPAYTCIYTRSLNLIRTFIALVHACRIL